MPQKTQVVIGFGPIGAASFLDQEYNLGDFGERFVSEVDEATVNAVRANGGAYNVNIATLGKRFSRTIKGVTICNPNNADHRKELVDAIKRADEIATALPKVEHYVSIVDLLAEGLKENKKKVIVYTAENKNNAAEILREGLEKRLSSDILNRMAFLNTVIGKMSQRVKDEYTIKEMGLERIAPGLDAFLVEETPTILLCRSKLPEGYNTSLRIFEEKEDLSPFDGAKLYGHNAVHALIGYLLALTDWKYMQEARHSANKDIEKIAKKMLLDESGAALIKKYGALGYSLITPQGYKDYADDLWVRITNPLLGDQVERVIRDPKRKLEWDDRIIGTMRLAIGQGIEPRLMALGAAAAAIYADRDLKSENVQNFMYNLWGVKGKENKEHREIAQMIERGHSLLSEWINVGKGDLLNYMVAKGYYKAT